MRVFIMDDWHKVLWKTLDSREQVVRRGRITQCIEDDVVNVLLHEVVEQFLRVLRELIYKTWTIGVEVEHLWLARADNGACGSLLLDLLAYGEELLVLPREALLRYLVLLLHAGFARE